MHREIAEEWAAALESGEFRQGFHALRTETPAGPVWCVWGVLCELAVRAGAIPPAVESSWTTLTHYDGVSMVPPRSVLAWAGIAPDIFAHSSTTLLGDLVSLNDGFRESFTRIAGRLRDEFLNPALVLAA
ncbi:hypothetical protein JOD54_002148 [Actinokineospora baliensis]|uniref:hypothetical protein n=1 Tax=Actinokineospora baliensis TaxID=547056 RepID=UPI00195BE0D9|nr:hypothetical protein [Actinokineospora baliensis]MBM7771944.1 hypothetical protein [Actinokineospora baliensis]